MKGETSLGMGALELVSTVGTDNSANGYQAAGIELWGGLECTVNRVGDVFHDQVEWSGHGARPKDLDRFAALGLRALRYPILWERIAPRGLARADWRWADERLGRLRELGMRPIVTLVHHGSGPRHTSLVDPDFAPELALFARAVAERYPWVEDYTPINEPLTTARFSGLYGHWYPHGRDGLTFLTALLNECAATVAAMGAIQGVNPGARLVQTEEVGRTFSTPALAYQATFENERRWLSLDLLCGRVGPGHPLWDYLLWLGVDPVALARAREAPCPPAVIGVNYYPTSDRFLDERCERYPPWAHGGNGQERYADIEAVRVRAEGPSGHRALLGEAWERYRTPLVVSEVHLGCTREEQLRWLWEAWRAASDAHDDGVDIRAVTAWSLLGAFDWQTLVTRAEGRYEPGAFDLRSPQPRPTAVARLLRNLAEGRPADEPVLATAGWWRRPDRLLYPAVSTLDDLPRAASRVEETACPAPPPLVILGEEGGLGGIFARHCAHRGLPCRLLSPSEVGDGRPTLDLAAVQPWGIIDTRGAAIPGAGLATGGVGLGSAAAIAAWCAEHRVALLALSSDEVFGAAPAAGGHPLVEGDPVCPVDNAGWAAVERERRLTAACRHALVVRTGPLFGLPPRMDPLTHALRALLEPVAGLTAGDAVVSPTFAPDAVDACLDLLIDGERGVWHVANTGATWWQTFVAQVAARLGLEPAHHGLPGDEVEVGEGTNVFRPLGSERGCLLGPVEAALDRHVAAGSQLVDPAVAVLP